MHYKFALIAISVFILSACGSSGSDDTPSVNGNKIPILSVANISSELSKGQTIELTATASDKDGIITSVVWQQTQGPELISGPLEAATTSVTLLNVQSYKPVKYASSP